MIARAFTYKGLAELALAAAVVLVVQHVGEEEVHIIDLLTFVDLACRLNDDGSGALTLAFVELALANDLTWPGILAERMLVYYIRVRSHRGAVVKMVLAQV